LGVPQVSQSDKVGINSFNHELAETSYFILFIKKYLALSLKIVGPMSNH